MNSSYQSEQLQALCLVRKHLATIPSVERDRLQAQIADYMAFRRRVDDYLDSAFGAVCSATCYRSRLSACCSREGIVTFFADVAINQLHSDEREIDQLVNALQTENTGLKCVYLGQEGCLWRVKPIVCQMFLCDPAKAKVFGSRPNLKSQWADFERERKLFTWPDRPVLFDLLEAYFISIGCSSSLMYLHQSPGLLRVKRRAGL